MTRRGGGADGRRGRGAQRLGRRIAAAAALFLLALQAPARAGDRATPDVPKLLPEPYGVMPFENRSGVRGLDWMEAGVPFVLAEKAEGLARLRPAFGTWVVPAGRGAPAEPNEVAAFAKERGLTWVWTGWIGRPDWELELGVTLWRMSGGSAARIGEVVARGEFEKVHDFVADAVLELAQRASLRSADDDLELVRHRPTSDFYAFTIFGRGLVDALAGDDAKRRAEAAKHFGRAVFIDPGLHEGRRLLAELERLEGRAAKAEAHLRRVLEERPRYAPAALSMAEVVAESGADERALELYERALALRPWDLALRHTLGQAYWSSGRVDDSYRELSRVVAREARNIGARRTLVLIHASRGAQKDLIRELEAVTALDPDDVSVRLDLGAAYAAAGRDGDAVRIYQAVVDADPGHVQALKFLGDLSKRAGKVQRAIRYYGLALEADAKDPRPYFLLGAAYVELGNDQAAKRIYRRAQRFKSYRAEAYNNLGAIAYREGKIDQSLWYLKRAVTQKPRRARYRYNYALSLSTNNATNEALHHADAGLDVAPDHVELNYLRGVVLVRLGEAEEARAAFARTLELEPGHPHARHNLALLDELKRRAEEGEIVIEGR